MPTSDTPNAAVTCALCGKDIPFVRPEYLPAEISLQCDHCGRRVIYQAEKIRAFVATARKQPEQKKGSWFR
jgi:DNA-directed RNA polymerase subunit RPC12/RpoP